MQRVGLFTLMTILTVVALAGCGGGEEQAAQEEEETTSNKVDIGGFAVVGPTGEVIDVPAVTIEPSDAETYLDTVRPVLEDTTRDLSLDK